MASIILLNTWNVLETIVWPARFLEMASLFIGT